MRLLLFVKKSHGIVKWLFDVKEDCMTLLAVVAIVGIVMVVFMDSKSKD